MTPRYPTVSGRRAVKVLVNHFDFSVTRQRGSHIVLARRPGNRKIVTVVPNHREVSRGTLRGLLKLAEVKEEDFFKKL